jgi:ribosomal protein S18 acetylase RimI-like enzyme
MPGIVRLVRTQLVPLSPWHRPRDRRLYGEIVRRLREGETLVASRSRSGDPFAFLHLIVRDSTLFVDLLAVDPSRQNRHWGTELMRRAEEYGLGKGCELAQLYVDEGNDKAHRFYRRLGYRTVRHVEELRCYQLEKPLESFQSGWLAAPFL